VRELAHELERAIVFSESDVLNFEHLEADASAHPADAAIANDWLNPGFTFPAEGFLLEEAINRLIKHALAQSGQNVSAAARLLGVTRDYLRYRLSGKQTEKPGD
jgi:DNA-binding NtrC family response regulator